MVEPYLARKPAALSGGQRQRVAMGRAIVREPQAFLMDEPLSNLDAKLRVSMRASLAELHERLHVTTVYVTHDQVEAMTLGQRVCVLRDGMLQQVDTPQNLFFIDAPPVEHKDVAGLSPQGEEDESAMPLHEGKSLWTARVNARSGVRAGDRIELGVDTSHMHFFDPDSGLVIGDNKVPGLRSATSKQQSRGAENTVSPRLAS
jgi:ABC-type proline/glycine betaine transport system ATPase subunit